MERPTQLDDAVCARNVGGSRGSKKKRTRAERMENKSRENGWGKRKVRPHTQEVPRTSRARKRGGI